MVLKILILIILTSSIVTVTVASEREFVKAILEIIDYMVLRHRVINLVYSTENMKDGYFMSFLDELITRCKSTYLIRLDNYTHILTTPNRIKRNSVFFLDTMEVFNILVKNIVPTKFDFKGNFLFVLMNTSKTLDSSGDVFSALWQKYVYNVNAIYKTDGNEIVVTTFLPFESSKSCGDTQPKIINKFRHGKFENNLIFPPKMRNFNGCPLRVVTFEDVDVVMRAADSDKLYGYGIELLDVLAEQLNFKPDINFLYGDFPFGIVYDNGTSVGALGELYKNLSDLAIGTFFLKPQRIKLFDYTTTFDVDDLVWVIPPGRFYSPLEKLLQPFSNIVWILISVIIIIGISVILIINYKFRNFKNFVYGTNVNHPLINMILVILGTQQTHLPKRNFARFLLMMFLIFCLVVRNIYQGALYQFLHSDGRHKEVQSVEEMIEKNFTFYAYELSMFDLIQASNSEIFKRTKPYIRYNFLLNTTFEGGERVTGLTTKKDVYSQELDIKFIKEPFMPINIVLYLRKNSFLTKSVSFTIDQLLAGGIMQHYIQKYYTDHHEKFSKQKSEQKKLKKLNIFQLSGAFYLLLFGEFFAFLALICEIAFNKFLLRNH